VYLILLAAFLACRLAQAVLAEAVRNSLARRHPQIWLELLPHNWLERNSVVDFSWRRGDRELNDPDLTVRVRVLNAVTLAGGIARLLTIVLLLVLLVGFAALFV
jgi:hypothetical protein